MVDLPRRNPQLIAQGFSVPDAQNTTIFQYRGNWSVGVVYNQNDFAQFIQTEGRPGLLLLCIEPHVSEIVFDESKWAALIDYDQFIQDNDTTGLAARVSALEAALDDGDFTKVDGSLTQILVRSYTEAEISALPSSIVPSAEFWYCTDSDPKNLHLATALMNLPT